MSSTYTTAQGPKTVLNRRERVTGTRGDWSVKSFGDDVQHGIATRRAAERLAAEYAKIERRHYRQAQIDHYRQQAAAAELAATVQRINDAAELDTARRIVASTPDPQPADRHDPANIHARARGSQHNLCGGIDGSVTVQAAHVTCPACLEAIADDAVDAAQRAACDREAARYAAQRRADDAGIALPTPTDTDAVLAELYPVDGAMRPYTDTERAALPFTPDQLAGLPEAVARELVEWARLIMADDELSPAELQAMVDQARGDQAPLPDGPATIPVRRIVTCYRAPSVDFSACGNRPPQRDTYRWDMVDCPACLRERDRRAAAAADAERAAAAASVMHYDTFGVPAMTGCGKVIGGREVGNANVRHIRPSRTTTRGAEVTCPDCLPAVARDAAPVPASTWTTEAFDRRHQELSRDVRALTARAAVDPAAADLLTGARTRLAMFEARHGQGN